MKRVQIAAVAVGALVFAVFVAQGGDIPAQADFFADGGIAPNRDATCAVRFDVDFAADAGVKPYLRILFPVSVKTLADAGRDVTMPPMPLEKARDAIVVIDWTDCTLAASTAPVASLWGTARPFTVAGVVKPWCRAKLDAGLPCVLLDGGDFGDRNVSACSTRALPATCERVSSGVIYAGDDPEDL